MNIPELDELYALYRADLYRYLCRLTRDSAAAEDLLSETFLRALKGAVTFRGESGVKTWPTTPCIPTLRPAPCCTACANCWAATATAPGTLYCCGRKGTATPRLPRGWTSPKTPPE